MKNVTRTFCAVILTACLSPVDVSAGGYFKISVVDEQTGRGVPLIELEATNRAGWWTDSNGIIALDDPGLMGQKVFFNVRGPGYEHPGDLFGNRGVRLTPERGGSATIKMRRLNIAERLYRITGEGIYRDSVLTGVAAPTRHPLLNAQVSGQDSVVAAPYRGKIYWFWGDTERIGYPLGNFGASGATSEAPGEGLPPDAGVDLTYFTDDTGFCRTMCPLPGYKEGLRWIEGLLTVRDEESRERLLARVANMRDLEYAYDWHLMTFSDEKKHFESVQRWDINYAHEAAHPFMANAGGTDYFYIYPNWRVRAQYRELFDLKNYESFTCVAGDGKIRGGKTLIDRDGAGRARYSWKKGADRLSSGIIRKLIEEGRIKPEENWLDTHDIATGERVRAGNGSVHWNSFRRRWIRIFAGRPGEVWFAESDTPTGPWAYARRIAEHDAYNFYNPAQHPFFDREHGRLIYFEGTYTDAFSDAKKKTPRYDYNQVMYRLSLDDPRLSLPAPVYSVTGPGRKKRYLMREEITAQNAWGTIEAAAFYAIPPEVSRAGLIPVFLSSADGGTRLRTVRADLKDTYAAPLFLALPPEKGGVRGAVDSVEGFWRGTVKMAGHNDFNIDLNLTQTGEVVKIDGIEGVSGEGAFEAGKLTLGLNTGDTSYAMTAVLKEDGLAGEWRIWQSGRSGTWSAKRKESAPDKDEATTVTALYEYEELDGGWIYSTDPGLGGGLKRAEKPLCRVWINPAGVLTFDPVAPSR